MERITGVVTNFNNKKGFGFIKSDKYKDDIFVHYSEIICEGYRTLPTKATVEFTVVNDGDGKKALQVTGVNGAPLPVVTVNGGGKVSSNDGKCFYCQSPDHFARNCPEKPRDAAKGGARGGGDVCHNCGKSGHFSRTCTAKVNGGGGKNNADKDCFECKEIGHIAKDCPMRSGAGSGDGGANGERKREVKKCYGCNEIGHIRKDCPNDNGNIGGGSSGGNGCYNCGKPGHFARDCDQESGAGGGGGARRYNRDIECYNCGGFGHFARDCNN